MRFEVGETALTLREAVAGVLARECPPAMVREGWPGGDLEAVAKTWRTVADTGAIGVLVPETDGGLGLDENCAVPLLETFGYYGLPVPVVETVVVAAPALAAAGDGWLADVLAGRAVVAVQAGAGDPLAFGATAQLALVWEGPRLRRHTRQELRTEPVATLDGSRAAVRVLSLSGGVTLSEDPAAAERARLRATLATAAVLVGLSRRMLDMTLGYVTGREQFGVPVGSFQALKHALVDALLAVEFARPLTLAAAWALARDDAGAALQVSAAKVLAGDAARRVAATALQCHGAMGYTTEYDLHLFAKRAWALAPTWGDAAWHRDRLATALGA